MGNETEANVVTPQRAGGSKKGSTCFKWKPVMSRFFIHFLAEQANQGLKVDKSFKPQAIHAAISAVNDRFGCKVSESNVQNHLRTLRARWAQIKQLKEKSGTGWDEKEKKIIMGEEEYQTYIEAHPKDEPYLNKPIEDYDELALICGNDQATKKYAKQSDQPLAANVEEIVGDRTSNAEAGLEELNFEAATPNNQHQESGQSSSRNNKRLREIEVEAIQELATHIKEVAAALKGSKSLQFSSDLWDEVMKLTNHSMEELEEVYDYLLANDTQARGFMAKPPIRRQGWVDRFLRNPRSDGTN